MLQHLTWDTAQQKSAACTTMHTYNTEPLSVLKMVDMDMNDDAEKKVVEGVFWNAVDILSEQDRRLPHIHAILPMLKRGIGVHHSGLLPILKEVIEILFQEGLIKVHTSRCHCHQDCHFYIPLQSTAFYTRHAWLFEALV